MSPGIVLDASVGLKLLLVEEYSSDVEALLQGAIETNLALFGPPHLFSEVANALHQRSRRGDITNEEAREALARNVVQTRHLSYEVALLAGW